MKLTTQEQKLLNGDYGDAARKLMEIAVKVGEMNGARRMVEITSVHSGLVPCYIEGPGSFGTIGIELLEDLAEAGLRFKVHYSTDPLGMDLSAWRKMGLPGDFARTQMRGIAALRKLGAILDFTCIPYLEGNVPKMGDHLAWVETGNVAIANSYFGACSNREVDLTALAAAICGRTPEYGYHLKENRYGDVLIKVEASLDYADLGALGIYAGKTGAVVPVFDGLPRNLGLEEVQQLIGAVSMLGPIAMVHIVGTTPEAPTVRRAFGNKRPKQTVKVGRKELDHVYDTLNTARTRDVDFVSIGCHFCTIEKVRQIARLLEGKKVNEGVTLWVQASRTVRNLAERDGAVRAIERAGGRVYCDACTVATSIKKHYGFKVMATDSAKNAFIVQGTPWIGADVLYGSTEKCIEAAVTGRW